ncbi:ABC transporter permease [Paenibacillus thalictri]|uniref:Sugar ABC transporter permease n=1 Tax=Paenibacillus thalictri TaxID=2527873 RepID=A0A4Q9DLT6_9BACL|nr:ABC transporter permease subunit [Paenibacillus thalictri]TBL76092.1 sugar ABC transporter permease [Paenibacillus thalictri]
MDYQTAKIKRQSLTQSKTKTSLWSELKRDKYLYLLVLPGIVYFLLFKYYPMWGLVIAFQEYSPYMGVFKSAWVGLENFVRFFENPDFFLLFRNTMMISLLSLVFFFPLPIVLSLCMNEVASKYFKRTIQSIVYLPHFLSWVIIAGITFLLLSQTNGIINMLFQYAGFAKIDFLTNPNFFWGILTGQNIWKDTGWGTIIFLAAMTGIDQQLYEAAKIDGANRLRQMWHITLPGIRNVIIILLILRLGHIMDVGFEQVFLMSNGAVAGVADVFETYVYRNGIQQGQFSYTTAVGLFKSVIGLVLVVGSNWLAKRFGEEGVY